MIFQIFVQLAQIEGELRGKGPLGLEDKDPSADAPGLFQSFINGAIGVLTAAGILWFLLQFILGAFAWITAGGNAEKVAEARTKVLNSVVGLVILFTALLSLSLIGYLLGFEDSILNIAEQLGRFKR